MNELTKIEKNILQIVKSITKKSIKKNLSEITIDIKNKLGDLGYKNEYEVASSIHNGEWIYDLVWFKEKNGILINVSLILESELSDRTEKGLRFDFEKLLISKSRIKVFICMAEGNYSNNAVINVKDLLYKSFDFFSSSYNKDRVLVLIWDDYNTGKLFHYIFKKND